MIDPERSVNRPSVAPPTDDDIRIVKVSVPIIEGFGVAVLEKKTAAITDWLDPSSSVSHVGVTENGPFKAMETEWGSAKTVVPKKYPFVISTVTESKVPSVGSNC